MAKWKIVSYTDKNHSTYETDSDEQKTEIFKREKARKDVDKITINGVRSYKR